MLGRLSNERKSLSIWPRDFNPTKSALAVAVFAIMSLSAFLRLWPIAGGLPYSDYIDEGYVLNQTIDHLNRRTYDCDYYNYPPLPSYLATGAMWITGPLYRWNHRHGFRRDLPREVDRMTPFGHNYNLIAPPELILVSRSVVVLLSVATVVVAGAIALRMAGIGAALLAMLFCAVCPALTTRGSTMIVDSVATFFALLSIYFAVRLTQVPPNSRIVRDAVLAAVAAAFAADSKYTVGAVFIVPVMAIAVMQLSWRRKLSLVLVAGVSFVLAMIAAAPALVLNPGKIVTELRAVADLYRTVRLPANYWQAALMNHELGTPLVVAGFAGFAFLLYKKSTRLMALSWLLFAMLLIAPLVGYVHQPFRNLLPLVPLLAIAAAILLSGAPGLLSRLFFSLPLRVAGIAVALIISGLGLRESWNYARGRRTRVDSRVRAIDWLRDHTGATDRILGLRELIILPLEWRRVTGEVEEVSWFNFLERLRQKQFDYVVSGNIEAFDPGLKRLRDEWAAETANWPVAVTFGRASTPIFPYYWRVPGQRIVILRNPVTRK